MSEHFQSALIEEEKWLFDTYGNIVLKILSIRMI